MYVHWKRRSRTKRHRPTGENTLTAVLVESERINGKPRQRTLCYLGSIGSERLGMYYHQVDFWISVAKHLDALSLPDEVRLKIESRLTEVVPKPSEEALTEEKRQLDSIVLRMKSTR